MPASICCAVSRWDHARRQGLIPGPIAQAYGPEVGLGATSSDTVSCKEPAFAPATPPIDNPSPANDNETSHGQPEPAGLNLLANPPNKNKIAFSGGAGQSANLLQQPLQPPGGLSASEKLDSRNEPGEPATDFRKPDIPFKGVEERRRENAELLSKRPPRRIPPSNATRVIGADAHAYALRKALLLADQVHGGDGLAPLEVGRNLKLPDEGELHGEYNEAHDGQPATAAVDERTSRPLNVMLHEFGHHILRAKFVTEAERDAVYSTARDTLTHERLSGKPASRYRDYMMSPEETFVRAYAQWVAEKSGDPEALAELARMRGNPYTRHKAWSPHEFKPVAAALDEIFKYKR